MAKFKIDEIAIFVGPVGYGATAEDLNKEIAIKTVASLLKPDLFHAAKFQAATRAFPGQIIYGIDWMNGTAGYAAECQLRKVKPPAPEDRLQRFRASLKPSERSFEQLLEDTRQGSVHLGSVTVTFIHKRSPADLEQRLANMWPPASSTDPAPAPRLQAFDNHFEGYDE